MASHPKPKRQKDTKFKAEIRKLNCIACGKTPSDVHHVKTVKSGGGDDYSNVMPLTRDCHQLVHRIGLVEFSQRFPVVKIWLLQRGWVLDEFTGKWIKPI